MSEPHAFTVQPLVSPDLDPGFVPLILSWRELRAAAKHAPGGQPFTLALAQPGGAVMHRCGVLFPEGHPRAGENLRYIERMAKFMLWAYGGRTLSFSGPSEIAEGLRRHYADTATGRFDSELIGRKIYGAPLEVRCVDNADMPPASLPSRKLGGNLDGCRIGFDLGGSDRKAAAVIDGKVVFSEEIAWSPYFEKDPAYHYEGLMDSLRRAARRLPRVDAIGGSAAGVYVDNEVRVASLFRGVAPDLFESQVRGIFGRVRRAWNNVPLVVMNDGEVTALAGAMALGDNAVLGVSMGTSQAAGFVTPDGSLTPWLNELAFAPVDARPEAPADEWSGDRGCGVQYFSQQAMPRLAAAAGIDLPAALPLPEKLVAVQELMAKDDPRARRVYDTIGTWFGYSLLLYADFYPVRNILVLGRVTSGPGGERILDQARRVLAAEAPDFAKGVRLVMPDETHKRHGQAVAAASLPEITEGRP
jgi:predicted NBD/HSP70 family sugar kinase